MDDSLHVVLLALTLCLSTLVGTILGNLLTWMFQRYQAKKSFEREVASMKKSEKPR